MLYYPDKSVLSTTRERELRYRALTVLLSVIFIFCSILTILRKDVTIMVDGRKEHLITYQHNVESVLAQAGVKVGSEDYLFPTAEEKVRTGSVITIKRVFPVLVLADGQQYTIKIADATVESVLSQLDLSVGALDRVEPAPEHLLARGDTIRITRVKRHLATERTEVPYREIKRVSEKLDRGTNRMIQKGVTGVCVETRLVTLEDGIEVSADLVQADVLRVKQDQIVENGTNTVLARSGYKLEFKEAYAVKATAYCAGTADCGCPIDSKGRSVCTGGYNDGITASGRPAIAGSGSHNNPHLVAVDPRLIPLGSRLYIDGYGFAIAADTGGAIKGKRLDLLLPTHQDALNFGRRTLQVYALID